jgi:hypothetical protein
MAIDAAATDRLKNDPETFLRDNFVKIAGYGTIGPAAAWRALGGGGVAGKNLDNRIAKLTLGDVPITADDCIEVTSIGGRTPPTCYLGLEPEATKPKYWKADVRPDKQPGYRRVLYLPARANQIAVLTLPAAGGPDLMFTDPLTGCAIYFGTVAGQEVVCHANALALVGTDSKTYMKGLKNAIPGFAKTASLKKEEYRADQQALVKAARKAEESIWRTKVVAQATNYTTVFGVRVGGHWRIYYQDYADVKSSRVAVAAAIKGKDDHHEARIGTHQVF